MYMRISTKGRYALVIMLDIAREYKNDKYINTFDSITEASQKLGVDPSTISKVCRGKLHQSKGYCFKYSI